MSRPLALIIMDGFGEAPASPANAITEADPRFLQGLRQDYPFSLLDCSGEDVGLPCGLMGNSEVGHLNIGAGRIVYQEISRIDKSIADGEFAKNQALLGAIHHAKSAGSTLHLMGLVSDGGVHSSDHHLKSLLDLCKSEGLAGDQVVLHAILDGRDTPPRSALGYVTDVEKHMTDLGVGKIATVIGRYYAMDRDKRWERTKVAYAGMVHGIGSVEDSATSAIQKSYAKGEGDEFVLPAIIGDKNKGRIRSGDAGIFFNYRTDRTRQLTMALTMDDFNDFECGESLDFHLATMTRYRADFTCPVAYEPSFLKGIFPEVVSNAGLSQLRIAETEKYAHVTFFISGGDEREYPGEKRILVPSPKVATYDMKPSMSAVEVTNQLLNHLDNERPDLTILNFANTDMVGHTGVIPAAIEAVQAVDQCLARIVPKYLAMGGSVAITADHGNCEMMIDPQTGSPHTAHTTNPVPFFVVGDGLKGKAMSSGRLCDIAPTLLPLLGLSPHKTMEGVDLL